MRPPPQGAPGDPASGHTSRGRVAAQFPADGEAQDPPRAPAGSGEAPSGSTPRRTGGPGDGGGATPRTRLTGRALLFGVIVAFLAVSFASSMRAYVEQRDHIRQLKSEIASSEATIADLERERRRWDDPAYVKAQARATLGYLMPGETGYQVLDENGDPLDPEADLHDPAEVGTPEAETAWWEDVWGSVELAGNPPPERGDRPAEKRIDGVKQNEREQQ